MRVVRFVAALSLSAGAALLAGNAFANDRLDSDYFLSDTKCDDNSDANIDSIGHVGLGGESGQDSFNADGEADGLGTQIVGATGRDVVEVTYNTVLPDKASANDNKGSVSQKQWSEVCVYVDTPPAGAALPVGGNYFLQCTDTDVEKCAVSGSVNLNLKKVTCAGKTSLNCSGTELSTFMPTAISDSVTAAFPKNNKCGVKWNPKPSGKKSSLTIKLNQKAVAGVCD